MKNDIGGTKNDTAELGKLHARIVAHLKLAQYFLHRLYAFDSNACKACIFCVICNNTSKISDNYIKYCLRFHSPLEHSYIISLQVTYCTIYWSSFMMTPREKLAYCLQLSKCVQADSWWEWVDKKCRNRVVPCPLAPLHLKHWAKLNDRTSEIPIENRRTQWHFNRTRIVSSVHNLHKFVQEGEPNVIFCIKTKLMKYKRWIQHTNPDCKVDLPPITVQDFISNQTKFSSCLQSFSAAGSCQLTYT